MAFVPCRKSIRHLYRKEVFNRLRDFRSLSTHSSFRDIQNPLSKTFGRVIEDDYAQIQAEYREQAAISITLPLNAQG